MQYRRALVPALLFILVGSLMFHSRAHSADAAFTLLANRMLVTDEVRLWPRRVPRSESRAQLIASPDPEWRNGQRIRLIYKTASGETISFYEEKSPRAMGGEVIERVGGIAGASIFLVETRRYSTGATGDGSEETFLELFAYGDDWIESILRTRMTYVFGRDPMFPPWNADYEIHEASEKATRLKLISGRHMRVLSIDSHPERNQTDSAVSTVPVSQHQTEPSFECAQRGLSMVEAAICRDPGLAALDSIMAALYRMKSVEDDDLVQEQREWMRERGSCISSRLYSVRGDCLIKSYYRRTLDLLGQSTVQDDEG